MHIEMTPPIFGQALFYNRRLPDQAGHFGIKKGASARYYFLCGYNAPTISFAHRYMLGLTTALNALSL